MPSTVILIRLLGRVLLNYVNISCFIAGVIYLLLFVFIEGYKDKISFRIGNLVSLLGLIIALALGFTRSLKEA